jgi:hypothetical protein
MPRELNKIIKLKNGREAQYDGDLDENGQPHGYGMSKIAPSGDLEGKFSAGMFFHGAFQGTGRVIFESGKHAIGQWNNDKLHGFAHCKYPNGDYSFGRWEMGCKCGFGLFKTSCGREFLGFYRGERHGVGLLVEPDGSKVAVEYKDGKVVSEERGV